LTQATRETAFGEDEICAQAMLNARALPLLVLVYAKELGQPIEDAFRFLGDRVAPGWDSLMGRGAYAVTRVAALNLASGGAELLSLSGDATRAEATMRGWPATEDLDFFGLNPDEADAIISSFGRVADRLGLRYDWRRTDDRITMIFAAAGAE
jgi:hypothetical protein